MRFDSGLLLHSGDLSNYPPVDEWKQTIRLLEGAGYTGVWAAEHHFFWDGWTNPAPTNPVLWGAFAAAHSTKLRIGQCGVALPDWHPLRVAEDVAMLDHLSEGRVDFGMLRGVNGRVSGNFNPAADRRDRDTNRALFWETFEIVEKAWRGQPFTHQGRFYEFPYKGWVDTQTHAEDLDPRYFNPDGEMIALEVVPQPYQVNGPPKWVMADSITSTVEAASRGVGVMSYAQSFEATRAAVEAYRGAWAGPVDSPQAQSPVIMRPIYVAPSQKEAEDKMRETMNLLNARGIRRNDPRARQGFLAADEEFDEIDRDSDWFDFLVRHDQCIAGTPEFVTEKLKRFEHELGVNHFALFWAVPVITFDEYTRSLKLFSDNVMPHF